MIYDLYCPVSCSISVSSSQESYPFGEFVSDCEEHVVTTGGCWESNDEVHGYRVEGYRWRLYWNEMPVQSVAFCLEQSAFWTMGNVSSETPGESEMPGESETPGES